MDLLNRINQHFHDSIKVQRQTMDLAPLILQASDKMAKCLKTGNKILSCGNGGSAEQAQHFASELVNRFEKERQGLAGIALTTDASVLTSIANDYSFDIVFSRQINALANQGDILFALSTSGNSPNILKAIEAAQLQNMDIILLSGKDGGEAARQLKNETDIEIRVPSETTARIQEIHLLVIHCLCDLIDNGF